MQTNLEIIEQAIGTIKLWTLQKIFELIQTLEKHPLFCGRETKCGIRKKEEA